jgi:hypothetical protein
MEYLNNILLVQCRGYNVKYWAMQLAKDSNKSNMLMISQKYRLIEIASASFSTKKLFAAIILFFSNLDKIQCKAFASRYYVNLRP